MSSDGRLAQAEKLWAIIAKHNLTEFKTADLWRAHARRMFDQVDDLPPVLKVLEELGYIRTVVNQEVAATGRPPSPVYEVNPNALAQNAQNAQNPSPGRDAPDVEVSL